MKHSTIKRLLSALLVLVFAFVLFPAEAYADLQDEIDELRKERLQIAEEHEQKQAVVDQLEEERAGLLERKLAMDERNELTRKEIENIEKEIALYDQMIAEAAIRVEQAKAVETEQLERYRVHVRAMEENGELGYLALILNANTLSELLTAVDDAGDIMRSDVELYDAYIAAREHTEEVKAEYEQTRAELEAKQEELRVEQEKLEAEIEEANRLITELDEDIERRNEELHELLLAEIETAEKIDNLVAEQERQRQEEERRRQQENGNNGGGSTGGSSGGGGGGGSVTATGSWGWPCPGCTYITSRAGNRFHPIFNEWRYHSGLDIGASHGSAVVASDSGTVIMAEVNGGYGNCIMIDHGNGYYTLYGHLSGYAVSSGQAVSKGQTIGYVGDTGWATGPHLHFEIRQGSTCLDPEAAGGFTGLSYAPDAGN
jgi:murein DD-endopeptidase MepM/ murein hydrolase activator NlpD